jgi:hypothetical protein
MSSCQSLGHHGHHNGRVQIKVYRGQSKHHGHGWGESFAPYGYWVRQVRQNETQAHSLVDLCSRCTEIFINRWKRSIHYWSNGFYFYLGSSSPQTTTVITTVDIKRTCPSTKFGSFVKICCCVVNTSTGNKNKSSRNLIVYVYMFSIDLHLRFWWLLLIWSPGVRSR